MSNVDEIYAVLGSAAGTALVLLVVGACCFGSDLRERWNNLSSGGRESVRIVAGAVLTVVGVCALGLGIHLNHLTSGLSGGMPGAPLVAGGVATAIVGFFTATA